MREDVARRADCGLKSGSERRALQTLARGSGAPPGFDWACRVAWDGVHRMQRSEVRGQGSEVRGQRSECRMQICGARAGGRSVAEKR